MSTAVQTRAPLGATYFRGVDGLRGIAVLSVLVFHTGLFHAGLFGVDLFFVLSGFLITLTLLREFHAGGTIHLGRFFARRAKRLLPLMLATLALTLAGVLAFGTAAELQRFAQQAAFSLVYLTNWEQIGAGQDYWAGFGELNPLGHLWSLAITEQFYLVWPLLVLGVLVLGRLLGRNVTGPARAPRRILALLGVGVVLFAVTAAQPALRYDGGNADRLYLGTDTHVAGLLAGAVAAIVRYLWLERAARRRGRAGHPLWATARMIATTAVSVAALTAIVVLSVRAGDYRDAWLYEWGFAVVAILGGLLTLTLTSAHNLLTRALSLAPLVAIGSVSYAVFLVHLPLYWLIAAIEPASSPVDLAVLGIPGSLLIGGGLHHLFAEPVRLRRWGRKGLAAFVTAGVVVTSAVVAGPALAMSASKGTGAVHVLTLGDSLATDFARGLGAAAGDRFRVTDAGLPGCGISGGTAQRTAAGIAQDAPASCNPWEERWTRAIDKAAPDAIVVDVAWDAVTQRVGGAWTDPTAPGFRVSYRAQLERLAAVTDRPGTRVFLANARLHSAVVTPEQATAFNAVLTDFAAAHPSITVLDLQATFCTPAACSTTTPDGSARYRDDRVHFSPAGQRELGEWLAGRITAGL